MRIADRLRHKRPVFSFEFFPPKTEAGEVVLWKSLEQLAKLRAVTIDDVARVAARVLGGPVTVCGVGPLIDADLV